MTSGNYGPPENSGQPAQPSQPAYGQQPPGYGEAPPPGQYGQPGYGQPAHGYAPGAPAPYTQPTERRGLGLSGLILTALGAIACVIAFTAVDWYKGGKSHFSDVSNVVDQADKVGFATGAAKVYFSWLAWVLLAAAVILAIIANLPTPVSGAFRALGALVGLAAIGMTFWAVQFLHHQGAYSEYIKNARVGFYLTLAGFLLITIGALIGPRRTTSTTTTTV